jgi:hypothetical protein
MTRRCSNSTGSNGTDHHAPISDADRSSAEAAAIAEVGEGTITDVDRSDDADHAWEVEVTFADEGESRTRVTLVHRHIDRHGEGWESLRAGLDAPDSWPRYLHRYQALSRGELTS